MNRERPGAGGDGKSGGQIGAHRNDADPHTHVLFSPYEIGPLFDRIERYPKGSRESFCVFSDIPVLKKLLAVKGIASFSCMKIPSLKEIKR